MDTLVQNGQEGQISVGGIGRIDQCRMDRKDRLVQDGQDGQISVGWIGWIDQCRMDRMDRSVQDGQDGQISVGWIGWINQCRMGRMECISIIIVSASSKHPDNYSPFSLSLITLVDEVSEITSFVPTTTAPSFYHWLRPFNAAPSLLPLHRPSTILPKVKKGSLCVLIG